MAILSKLTAAALFLAISSLSVKAQSSFTPFGGFSSGVAYSMESVVSGNTLMSNGDMISHGSLPLPSVTVAAVETLEFDLAGDMTEVYTVEGMHVMSVSADSFSPSMLNPGLYIIRNGHSVRKFLKTN